TSLNKRIIYVIFALLLVALFWGFYEVSNYRIYDIQLKLSELSSLETPIKLWQSVNSIFTLPISLILIIIWTKFYNSQFTKLILGFVFGVIAFGLLFLIPEIPTDEHAVTYIISLGFLAISEVHIAPIIHSILTKYSNPKYLAILISLSFLPTSIVSYLFGSLSDEFFDNPIIGLKIGLIGMASVALCLIGYVLINRKNYLQQRV
ncbi:MAG: hypothetical protein HRU26_11905, partial [Psychroserpens sp.]|nr:hypothetical protein [Psychroserpens sp.]